MVEDAIKIIFITFFIYWGIGLRGPIKNPFWEYFPIRDSYINKFLLRLRFFEDWGVFTGCSEHFVDVRVIAIYKDRRETWYFLKDKNIAGLNIHSKATRLLLAFYYARHDFILSKAILASAKKQGDLTNLYIESILGDSLDDHGYKKITITHSYLSWSSTS